MRASRAGKVVRGAGILPLLGAAVVASVAFAPASGASGSLTARFVKTSDWGTGYVADYDLANGGPTVTHWTLSFTLAADQVVVTAWNGVMSHAGTRYTIKNESWNGHLGTGGSAQVGLYVTYSGKFVAPSACLLNGKACTGSVPPPTTTAATTTSSPPPTTTTVPPTTTTVPPTTTTVPPSTTTVQPPTTTVQPPTTTLPPPTTTLPPPTTTLPPLPAGEPFPFAPYVDTTVDSPPFSLVDDAAATGTHYFTLGFVTADAGCTAAWGGHDTVSSGYYVSEATALKEEGGDAAVSFGGAAGTDLADVCTSASDLQAQYQSVIDEYSVTHLDFDVEGTDLTDSASIDRRFEAIAGLETADPDLFVSVTLPVLPTGLSAPDLAVLAAARTDGARVDLVNIATMDYGDDVEPDPSGQMGSYAIEAAESTESQLADLYPDLTSGQLYAMIGVTPMLGVNDVADEIFGLTDAQQLAAFVDQVHAGTVSFWAATRDSECPDDAATAGDPICSGISQAPYAFSGIFAG